VAQLRLFINTTNNQLVAGQTSTQIVPASTLPIFCNDTLDLIVYLLQIPIGYNAQNPAASTFETLSTSGLTLFAYLNNGLLSTAGGYVAYASCLSFTADATNTYFSGSMSLNTAALQTLLGSGTQSSAFLMLGISHASGQTTVFNQQVTVRAGAPIGSVVPIPGFTALSLEVAKGLFYPQQPIAGLPLFIESPAGKIFAVIAVDMPDGTASPQFSRIN
jgi:hypothetical protein